MYDLHCHMLPDFDDGAVDLETALTMARMAVKDGITHLACTPHIYPGLYEYDTESIQQAIHRFEQQLKQHDIPLTLGMGADIQMVPEMIERLKNGSMPTINGSSYLLFEPPHHVAPSHFEAAVSEVLMAGYTPIITHPERLGWLPDHYDEFLSVAENGAWMQITAGSLTGNFGQHAKQWAERMLNDGVVHMLATDGHNTDNRAPQLSGGLKLAIAIVGKTEAQALVYDRPKAVWENQPVESVSRPPGFNIDGKLKAKNQPGLLKKLFGRRTT